MTETVTITGQGLTIVQDHTEDPKRKRPKRFAASSTTEPRSPSGWTIEEMIDMPNPFWPEKTNHYD